MTKFEYKTIEVKSKMGFTNISIEIDDLNKNFNQLGSEGWELVAASPIALNGSSFRIYYTFKRPI